MGFEEAVSAISNAAALASGRNASGGAEVDGPCRSTCTGTRCEESVPVTSADSSTFADLTVATRSGIVNARLRIELITPTATAVAAAAAKTVILRIAFLPLPPNANAVVHEQHDQLRSVNIWFAWPVRGSHSGSPTRRLKAHFQSPQFYSRGRPKLPWTNSTKFSHWNQASHIKGWYWRRGKY